MPRVVIIDEEMRQLYPLQRLLNSRGVDIISLRGILEAIDFLDSRKRADLYIVDIMQEPSPLGELETHNGLLSGIVFVEKMLRPRRKKTPIIFLSNMHEENFGEVHTRIQSIDNSIFVKKSEYRSPVLADLILEVIENGIEVLENPSLARRIKHALKVEPNFYGIGIDFKKL